MATDLDLPKEILDLEDWVALGQGTSKVADYQVKMHQYIRALCAAVKKQSEEITDLRKRVNKTQKYIRYYIFYFAEKFFKINI